MLSPVNPGAGNILAGIIGLLACKGFLVPPDNRQALDVTSVLYSHQTSKADTQQAG